MINSFQGDYRFLSNFWPVRVQLDGATYTTVEHAYQAAKTLDDRERNTVRRALTPGEAKRAGRRVTKRADWEQVKIEVMRVLLQQKFRSDYLHDKLQATRGHELVEGNTWGDTFWGVCRGVGENHLGKLLMQIRDNG